MDRPIGPLGLFDFKTIFHIPMARHNGISADISADIIQFYSQPNLQQDRF